ncbi:MAG: ATP-binding protein [Sulfitobacter litoralis]|jgi:signal transduction histidine kinase|uniref:histidine kinase n=1 Tax=Sulfitobacter litoralis TaxID=335975 RepID=A0ABY0SR63_9RHOB|nr:MULTISPECIES: MHYT domain-containing protein [Sulfitobacter]MBQ0717420.1 ATP-binding protein [Sulfitobacter litoralis]MBQ0767445.1 ATP-binding protein [Sulfitobacter litoralis]MBQ0802525.1 ATP-binding protein [Sulfitobacter litoralis]MCF7726233.1 ATPase [Sulfitobacter sp. M22]MCF7777610.1 ATPase [Sulfitobacter sp. M220]|tara:strand:- start:407 stop:1948 length:1542 start_codon:yes stop_codon:yes gene_type:complete
MIKVAHTIHHDHDFSLVLLALLLCAFGSWVVSRLYQHALGRPRSQALIWYMLTALTAGVAIWCTHFIAILAYQPAAPVTFNLQLTFISLLIAIAGCTVGIIIAGMFRSVVTTIIGGAVFGMAVSAMHYTGMVAYRVEGLVDWDRSYLIASILLAIVFSTFALYLGSRVSRHSGLHMTSVLTLSIVGLHFTGMAAFSVNSIGLKPGYANPEEYKLLALLIAGTATMITLGGLFTYFIEIRTRRESIEELREARDAAEAASRAKSEFMSVLSHELRTPLTIVIGYASFLTKLKSSTTAKLPPSEPITEKHYNIIGDQAELYGQRVKFAGNHLLTIINDILDYTSIELNDIKLAKSTFPTQALLAQVEDQFQGLAQGKDVALHVPDGSLDVIADRGRCLQILINLVGNALKFSKAKDIYLRAEVDGGGFRFEVEDNGIGMAQKDLESIFEAFTQIENADNRSEGGTGLGLAICKKLALAHGGDISVSSTVGKGTRFSVFFPHSLVSTGRPSLPVAA